MGFTNSDIYVVRSDFFLGDIDKKVLTYLYQPIVGVGSIGFYNTLWNELDHYKLHGKKNIISKLLKVLSVSLEEFNEYIRKVEAVGLINTYMKLHDNNNCYVFELCAPLSPKSFIDNDVLSSFLRSKLTEKEFGEILGLFNKSKFNKDKYSNETHSFNQVFGSYNPEAISLKKDGLLGNRAQNKTVIEGYFDISMFEEKIKGSKLLLPEKYITDDLLEVVKNLSFVYDYDVDTMVRMVRDSFVPQEGVDVNTLRDIAKTSYSLKRSVKGPMIIEKNEVQDSPNVQMTKLEEHLINTTPYLRLKGYFNGGEPPIVDLKILDEVLNDIKLKPEVLNVLIDYVMHAKDLEFTRGLVTKIAGEWKRSGIETVSQAIAYAKEKHNERKDFKNKQVEIEIRQKNESKPEWVNEKIEGGEVTEEEIAKQKEKIRKMFGE